MHIITVYPLAKGMRQEALDYFFSRQINRGTIVSVPIGGRTELAVVADCNSTQRKKAALRSADYELKPVKYVGNQIFFEQFLEAVEEFARFSGVTTGAALRALTVQPIIDKNQDLPKVTYDMFMPDVAAPKTSLIQDRPKKQIQYCNSVVRSHLDDKESVFICTPTTRMTQQLATSLRANVVTFTSELTKTEVVNRWENAVAADDPQVLVGTPPFLSLPRPDLGRIIVYSESNSSYKMQSRPFLDKSLFARFFAQNVKRQSTLVDSVPQITTQWEYRNDNISAEFKPNLRRPESLRTQLIDMKEVSTDTSSGVQVFAPPTVQLLRDVQKDGGHVLLFVARRGRRPFTICNDCGNIVECSQCSMPLTLVEKNDSRQYVCRTCGNRETSRRRCHSCNSWRLEPLGIGIDFVAEILNEHLDNVGVFQTDSDTQPDQEAAENTLEGFYASDSGILLTTQLGLNHLTEAVDSSVVVTADSLLAIPDLNIPHQLFSLLMKIRDYTQDSFIIQTRSKETGIPQQALDGNITGFYENQIARREDFQYPPFSYLIKLTVTGSAKQEKSLVGKISKRFSDYDPQVYPTKSDKKGKHILIRIDREKWVDEDLLDGLRSLPPSVSINAHPRSLL